MELRASWGNLDVSVYHEKKLRVKNMFILFINYYPFIDQAKMASIGHLYFLALVRVLDVVLGINY